MLGPVSSSVGGTSQSHSATWWWGISAISKPSFCPCSTLLSKIPPWGCTWGHLYISKPMPLTCPWVSGCVCLPRQKGRINSANSHHSPAARVDKLKLGCSRAPHFAGGLFQTCWYRHCIQHPQYRTATPTNLSSSRPGVNYKYKFKL